MEPERWREIERLYHAALGRPESERSVFLQEACASDETLRREVESLLVGETQAENFLESPAVAIAAKALAAGQAPAGASSEAAISMVGKRLGHYRILEKIGAGGMGVVYRARDERLDRDVALKVLPRGVLADEASRKRFRREALSLSRLNHPNIETVHDFDTQEGVDFLVMEYIAGEGLDVKVASGPLPEKETVRLVLQLAEGLAAAHEQGVVHRDLKPGNLRVTLDGRLKILDFGLAKLISPKPAGEVARTESLAETQAGAIAGTLPYMSPEQLRGEKVDARSDIYAVGALLYEMAAGRRPFLETQTPRLIDAILHQAPQSPCVLNQQVSPGLEGFILKCLEKDPNLRYQTAGELRADLERLSAGASVAARHDWWPRLRWAMAVAGTLVALLAGAVGLNVGRLRARLGRGNAEVQIRSLAVLPLENLSADPEQEYFAEGMTDELITDLAKISALRVISRSSVMRYKGTNKPVPEIARELKVDGVIEGSVLRSGNRVRITAQLIHAATGQHVWAESYERDLRDVLGLQDEVARTIAGEIKVTLTPQEHARLASARPINPEAHELFLRGLYFWEKRGEGGLGKAVGFLQHAVEKDPSYAPAWAALADAYTSQVAWEVLPPKEGLASARAAAEKALQDDTLAAAHISLAYSSTSDWDWLAAEKESERGIQLGPGSAKGHLFFALALSKMGRAEEANAEVNRAHDVDPLSVMTTAVSGWILYLERRYDQAVERERQALDMAPNSIPAHYYLGLAYEQQLKYIQAIEELQKAVTLSGDSPQFVAAAGHAYAVSGNKPEALRVLGRLRERSNAVYVSSFSRAIVYTGLGQKELAFTWLQKAFEERAQALSNLKVDPRLDPLRSDPRFQDLLRRVGLSP